MSESSSRYQDIIGLDHPISKRHARMSMEGRAAQFAPFAALTGFEDSISESIRLTVAKEALSESALNRLNTQMGILLEHIKEEPEVSLTYFVSDEYKQGGAYVRYKGHLKKIDTAGRMLYFTDQTVIGFDDLETMDSELFRNQEP